MTRAAVLLMLALVGALVVLAVAGIATTPAVAQAQCGPRDAVLAHLSGKYAEGRQAVGLAANGMVVEVFSNRATGSWTITYTTADGMTCLIASGTGFEAVADAPGVPG